MAARQERLHSVIYRTAGAWVKRRAVKLDNTQVLHAENTACLPAAAGSLLLDVNWFYEAHSVGQQPVDMELQNI